MTQSGLGNWRLLWERAGFPVIPLQPFGKRPVANAWNCIPPLEQWRDVGGGFRGNLGVRLGDGFVCIDCDSSETISNVQMVLKAIGLSPPYVVTPSGGRHYYLRMDEVPTGFNWKRLSADVGSGELRARNAYVVVPCSQVAGKRYRFERGGPDDIPHQRKVHWKDLARLLPDSAIPTAAMEYDKPPIPLIYRPGLFSNVNWLLEILPDAPKSQPVDKYPTRSEAEAAIVTNLILAGWQYDKIEELFENHKPGHYWEAGNHRHRYLKHTYTKMLTLLATTPERQKLTHAYTHCRSWGWPGRAWRTDLAVFQAIVAKAWQFDSFCVQVSVREMAEYACVSRSTVSTSVGRLSELGYIRKRDESMGIVATCWQIRSWTNLDNNQNTTLAGDCAGSWDRRARRDPLSHTQLTDIRELWSPSKFGRTAEAIYYQLGPGPQTEKVVAEMIGIHPKTAVRNLKKLAEEQLAEKVSPNQWVRGPANLEDVSQKLGTAKAAAARRNRYEREREDWRNQEQIQRSD